MLKQSPEDYIRKSITSFSLLYAKWNENKVYRPIRQNRFGTTVGSFDYWKYCSIIEPPPRHLFEWFVIIKCERTDKYTHLFTKKISTCNALNYIHNDRYFHREKIFTFFREMLSNYLTIRQMLNLLC